MPDEPTPAINTRIRDNDPRADGRERTVVTLTGVTGCQESPPGQATHVLAVDTFGKITRIRIDRIHTDGKPRRSGWSAVA